MSNIIQGKKHDIIMEIEIPVIEKLLLIKNLVSDPPD